MNILIACEYSGIVRDAFIERGHNAISCDLLPTERPGPHRWKLRSKTYEGIVKAMADQWSDKKTYSKQLVIF